MGAGPSREAVDEDPATVVIAGGGIVGLVLAMALKKHVNVRPEVYEKTHTFATEAGAGLGMVRKQYHSMLAKCDGNDLGSCVFASHLTHHVFSSSSSVLMRSIRMDCASYATLVPNSCKPSGMPDIPTRRVVGSDTMARAS